MDRFALRLARLSLACGLAFGGCTCSQRPPAPPTPPAASSAPVEEPASPPTKPEVKDAWCPTQGAVVDSVPANAYRGGRWAVLALPHWQEPPDDSQRFVNVPGIRDIARAADQAFMVRRRLPDDHYVVLTAKVHDFPAGTTFDEAGKQKAFDEVAANPHAAFLGAKVVQWGGQPAIEGAVKAVYKGGPDVVVHHLILPIEGSKALVVTFFGRDDNYGRFLAEACDSVVAVK